MKNWLWTLVFVSFCSVAQSPVYNLLDVNGAKEYFSRHEGVMHDVVLHTEPELAQYTDIVREWEKQYYSWEAMKKSIAPVYTALFTENELRELATYFANGHNESFHATVIWAKYQRLKEEINKGLITAGYQHQQEVMPYLYEMIAARDKNTDRAEQNERSQFD